MQIEIQTAPARRVAYLRALGSYPQTLPALWPKFTATLPSANVPVGGVALSIMHDDESTMPVAQLRGDAAMTVPDDWQPQGGLEVETIPGGLYAVTEHVGPYNQLAGAWGEFIEQVGESAEYQIAAAACYEIYLNDPRTTAPEDLRTELYLPVETK